jgi:hypothetical protein
MWIFLSDSFVSIVQDRNDKSRLMVRGRRPGDVERFLSLASLPGEFPVSETPHADYRFRASVPRGIVSMCMSAHAERVDYSNFKNTVGDPARHVAYLDVWSIMSEYQEEP